MEAKDTDPPAASPDARRAASDPETLRWGSMTVNGRHFPVLGERKYLATLKLLRRRRDLWAIYRRRRLEPRFREEIMLAAAGADSSRQCSFAHREWARAEGLSEEELAALEGLEFDAIDERKWAAFAWAQAYARNDFGDIPVDVAANFRHHFDAQERADIELAARTMYWLNETSNSVDAFLDRVKRELIPGKHEVHRAGGARAVRRHRAAPAHLAEHQAAAEPHLDVPRDASVLPGVRGTRPEHDLRTGRAAIARPRTTARNHPGDRSARGRIARGAVPCSNHGFPELPSDRRGRAWRAHGVGLPRDDALARPRHDHPHRRDPRSSGAAIRVAPADGPRTHPPRDEGARGHAPWTSPNPDPRRGTPSEGGDSWSGRSCSCSGSRCGSS